MKGWAEHNPMSKARPPDTALLDFFEKWIDGDAVPRLRVAVAAGDSAALEVMRDVTDEIRALIPTFVKTAQQWFFDRDYQALEEQGFGMAQLALAVGDDAQAAHLFGATARAWQAVRDPESAAALYQQAITLREGTAPFDQRQHYDIWLSEWYRHRGQVLVRLERFEEAIESFRCARDLEQSQDPILSIRVELGSAYRQVGQYKLAIQEHQEVCDELDHRPVVHPSRLAWARSELAVSLAQGGDVERGLAVLEQLAETLPPGALDARRDNTISRLAIYYETERFEEAAALFPDAWAIAVEAARPRDVDRFRVGYRRALNQLLPPASVGSKFSMIGDDALRANDWHFAAANYRVAILQARQGGDQFSLLRWGCYRAAALADAQDATRAREECLAIREAAQQSGLALPVALSSETLATLERVSDPRRFAGLMDTAWAFAYAELHNQLIAEDFARYFPHYFEAADLTGVYKLIAEFAAAADNYQFAEEYYRKGLTAAQDSNFRRGKIGHRLGLLELLDQVPDRTEDADALACELRTDVDDLETADVMRLGVLYNLGRRCADAEQTLSYLSAAAESLEELRARQQPGAARSDLDRQYGVYPALLHLLQHDDTQLEKQFATLQAMRARRLMEMLTAKRRDPNPYQPIELDEVQQRLSLQKPTTTFVDITATDGGLRAYLVDQAGLRCVDVSGDVTALRRPQWGDVDARVAEVIALVAHSPLLAELASTITNALEPDSTVLIAVDDDLANLPLHAIPIGDRPWCDVVSIGRIPAAGVLRFTLPNRSWSDHSVVAGNSKGDLPGAQQECEVVADLLGAELLVGDECTLAGISDALKSAPTRLDVVHLAVHGRADPRRGGRSSLLFAGDPPTWVLFEALAAVPWDANLIVFSGCSTAVGGPREGAGLYGVAQAAAERGATTVIASLWPVSDTAADIFMEAFYTALSARRGSGPIDLRELMDHARTVLRQTTLGDLRAVRRDNRDLVDPDPHLPPLDEKSQAMTHWASFVLMGEPRLVV
jgi:CHAT domain-containing protein/tetratricopeptide (TPR) repeat protein